jgi:hypothetical protein
MRLSGPRSRPTATQKIWQCQEPNPGPLCLQPGSLTTRPQRQSTHPQAGAIARTATGIQNNTSLHDSLVIMLAVDCRHTHSKAFICITNSLSLGIKCIFHPLGAPQKCSDIQCHYSSFWLRHECWSCGTMPQFKQCVTIEFMCELGKVCFTDVIGPRGSLWWHCTKETCTLHLV